MSNYLTVEEANEYVSTHYISTDTLRTSWESLSDADKEVLLTSSTEAINMIPWPGKKAVPSQPNAFPRWPDTEVPVAIVAACVENALSMTDSTVSEETNLYKKMWAYGLSSYSIGNFSETIVQGGGTGGVTTLAQSGIVSVKAQTILGPFLGGGFTIE